jgi:hypothetical protein
MVFSKHTHADVEWSFVRQIETSLTKKIILLSTLQILRLLAEDAHLESKRSYEGEPSRSEWSGDSATPLLSGFRRGTQSDLGIGSAEKTIQQN